MIDAPRPLTEAESIDLFLASLDKDVRNEVQQVYGLSPCCSAEFGEGSGMVCTHPVAEMGRSCFVCVTLAQFRKDRPELSYRDRLLTAAKFTQQVIDVYGIRGADPSGWFADWDPQWTR